MNATERIQILENEIAVRENEIELLEHQIKQCQHTLVEIHSFKMNVQSSWCNEFMKALLKNERIQYTVKRMKCSTCGWVTHIHSMVKES